MRVLARYVMAGRVQAMLVAAASALLALLLPPLTSFFAYLGGGAVALVTLVQGAREGAGVILGAALAMGLFASLVFASATPVVIATLLVWIPVWLAGLVLRATVSLRLAIGVLALFTLLLMTAFHLSLPDPAAWWAERLEPVLGILLTPDGLDPAFTVEQVTAWMTALSAAALLVGILLCLLLGRWWQALLYNPGGFGNEFKALRFDYWSAGFVLLLWALATVPTLPANDWMRDAAIVLSIPFMVAGLAVVHNVVAKLGLRVAWLVVVYLLLLFAWPAMEFLLAILGIFDSWLDIRRRLAHSDSV